MSRVQALRKSQIEEMEVASSKCLQCFSALLLIHVSKVFRQFWGDESQRLVVMIVLEVLWDSSGEELREDRAMLPIYDSNDVEIFGNEDVVRLEVRVRRTGLWSRAFRGTRYGAMLRYLSKLSMCSSGRDF